MGETQRGLAYAAPGIHRLAWSHLQLRCMLGSDCTRRQHTSQQIATAEREERLWMKIFGAHQQLLESIIYRGIKKCWSGYTEALVIFGRITVNDENCAGLVQVGLSSGTLPP